MNSFLTEDNGNFSATRLMCVIALMAAILFGLIAILTDSDTGETLACTFLTMAFAGKVSQKPFEQKSK
jgi:hypothetical protein